MDGSRKKPTTIIGIKGIHMKRAAFLIGSLIFISTTAFADAPRTSAWNPTAAKNYALQYAMIPNKNYVFFSNDCTNFVSQIMRAGGWKDTTTKQSTQDTSWYYTSKAAYAQTWSTAQGFRNRLNNGYERGAEKLSRSGVLGVGGVYLNNKIAAGDVIFVDWTNDGRFDHAMSVVSKSYLDTRVAYHTTNEDNGSMVNISANNLLAGFEAFHIS